MKDPQIITISNRQLVGKRITTSLAAKETETLWKHFKPRIKEISEVVPNAFFSVQIYSHQGTFTPDTQFEKWAAVEVKKVEKLPVELETLTIPEGMYAVFIHKGLPGDFPKTSQYIFGKWFPSSGYELDNRPQFEVMYDQYRPNDPDAEEEVWVPIRKKKE